MSGVLVIDDEPELARLISRILSSAGYRVTEASTGHAGLNAVRPLDPDLIVLDLILPDMRGEDVLASLMATRPASRVLVLSSLTEIATRVSVLEHGAVDYLAKPFAIAELVARVRARIRTEPPPSTTTTSAPKVLRCAGLEVDVGRREIIADGQRIELTEREFDLLCYLIRKTPVPCSRAELLKGVWGTTFDAGTNVVDVCVKRLRFKLSGNRIETVRNVGYRLAI